MKSIARMSLNKWECSVQESAYNILQCPWLQKTFPGVIFANNNVTDIWFQMCLNEDKMSEIPVDSKTYLSKT